MGRKTQITILCEDLQQEIFARTFLVACGTSSKRIRSIIAPKGKGAAEAFVRNQYPVQVSAYRRRRNAINIDLVVMIDADVQSVQHHYDELDQELRKTNLPIRQSEDQIGIFIPKRNIETWIYYLMGSAVNEEDEYPHLPNAGECKPYVETLARNRQTIFTRWLSTISTNSL
jgi:hypothetical protein